MQKQADGANVWIGADFNGYVGEGNAGVEVNIGKHGVGRRNDEGDRIVEFAAVNNLAVTNTYFKRRLSRKITYTSGHKNSQVDYILCRRREMRNVQDCYVLPGEAVAKQHKVVVCRMVIKTNGKQTPVKVKKTKWWKLNLEEHRVKFVDKVKAILDTEGSKTWERASKAIRETPVEVLGRTSGKAGKKEETWWWNEEVQESIKAKKSKKKERDLNRNAETIESYKLTNKAAKRAVAKAKNEVYKDLYKSLAEGEEGIHKAIRIAKQKNKDSQDVYQGRQVKSSDGTVLVEEEEVTMRWSTYFEQLMMIIENGRIERVIPPAAERQVAEIERTEVLEALRKMKKGKAVGPDDIPIEAWRVVGEVGVETLLNIFTEIMETEKMPEEWRDSVLVPVFKNKGDILDCGNYRGIKLMAHTLKMWERVIE